MPQPALHLSIARAALARWTADPATPFDTGDADSANAFLIGCLAHDMGNFPGGSRAFAHAVHTVRTGAVARDLLAGARTDPERAFAWGWLSHMLADVAIHPIVNDEVARRGTAAEHALVEHVRVEVGIDARAAGGDPALNGLALRPAFGLRSYTLLADVLEAHCDLAVGPDRLMQMERGLILFSHGAVHFAQRLARPLPWRDRTAPRPPLTSAVVWHLASRISPRNTVVHAYLNPHDADATLMVNVTEAVAHVARALDGCVRSGVGELPDYNLENGTVAPAEVRRVA